MLTSRQLIRIATIGPSFEVLGGLTADLAPALDLNVSLAYTVQNVHFVFPLSYGPSTGTFAPSDNSKLLPCVSGRARRLTHTSQGPAVSASSTLNADANITATSSQG